jgi:hypothetical protein
MNTYTVDILETIQATFTRDCTGTGLDTIRRVIGRLNTRLFDEPSFFLLESLTVDELVGWLVGWLTCQRAG